MFNLGRFNLMRFGVRTGGTDELFFSVEIPVRVRCALGSGEDIYERHFVAEGVESRGMGAAGVVEAMEWAEAFDVRGQAYLYADGAMAAGGAFGGAGRAVTVTWLGGEWVARLMHEARVGGDVWLAAAMKEGVRAGALYAAEVHLERALVDEAIGAAVSQRRFEMEQAYLDVTVPPGSTLVLDSGGYVLLLDGENVIDRHSGGWPRLSREALDLRVETAGGDARELVKEVLYTVKWL